jgi:hypothetical protein
MGYRVNHHVIAWHLPGFDNQFDRRLGLELNFIARVPG